MLVFRRRAPGMVLKYRRASTEKSRAACRCAALRTKSQKLRYDSRRRAMLNAHRVSGVTVLTVLAALGAPAAAADDPKWQGEAGIFGGVHLFSKTLELGQYDDPGNTTSPANSPVVGLRL